MKFDMKLSTKVVLKSGAILETITEPKEGATKEEVMEDIEAFQDYIAEGLKQEATGGISIGSLVINIQEIAGMEIGLVYR